MSEFSPGDIEIIGCGPSVALAEEVASHLGVKACIPGREFANREMGCTLPYSVRGEDVFVVGSHTGYLNSNGEWRSPNDAFMEHVLTINTASRSWAGRVIAVSPFLGYGRADHLTAREPLAASLVGQIIETAGASGLMTFDPHASQTQGFFRGPSEYLKAEPVLLDRMQQVYRGTDLVIVSPDQGRYKASCSLREGLERRLGQVIGQGVFNKDRDDEGNGATVSRYIGTSVEGRVCAVNDDMADGCGTLEATARELTDAGAVAVDAWITHPVMSEAATERLASAPLRSLYVTDTIPLRPEVQSLDQPAIEVVSIAHFLAEAIRRTHEGISIAELHNGWRR